MEIVHDISSITADIYKDKIESIKGSKTIPVRRQKTYLKFLKNYFEPGILQMRIW